jgi:hypothetical protein
LSELCDDKVSESLAAASQNQILEKIFGIICENLTNGPFSD